MKIKTKLKAGITGQNGGGKGQCATLPCMPVNTHG